MRRGILAVAVTVMLAAVASHATPIGLVQCPPDIYSDYIFVNYAAVGNDFTATGYTFTFDLDGGEPPDYTVANGTFDIAAKIDNSGNPTSGELTINGYIPDLLGTNGSGTLLTGSLSRFGYPDNGGDILEFVFTNTGGDLAGYFPQADVILASSGFPGGPNWFTQDFDNSNYLLGARADTFVPEPITCLSFLGAMTVLGGYVRKRVRQSRQPQP